jgi:hypothetical protein
LCAPVVEERIGGDKQCIDSLPGECLEGGVDLALSAGFLDLKFQFQLVRGRLQFPR